jgi:hypothetical protein
MTRIVMMMSMAIQDVYGRYMMFKDWPRGAALWWRRIPTATSGRAVRESDRMLLGSAHAVPTHEDVHKMCSHVPSGAALQEPAGGGPRTRREHRRGARASPPTQKRRRAWTCTIIAIITITPIIITRKKKLHNFDGLVYSQQGNSNPGQHSLRCHAPQLDQR